MNKKIFNFIKNKIPKISSTELIALRSGTTSIDRSILLGELKFPEKLVNIVDSSVDNKVNKLFDLYDGSKMYPNKNKNKWIEYLAKNKFFSFIIDRKYDGNKLSVNELSNVLTKITSVDPSLGVVTMVPNSLGPGELLINYGTEKQKEKYLPKLSNGEFIPCFGLTGPNNGSDATGNIDTGKVVIVNNKKYIETTINKRYITLAPVSNLIGLAIDLQDPDNLLSSGNPGITVALIEKNTCGLIQDTHHNPLDVGFPNGTLKGNLLIPIENIIGGESNSGYGWKMLMDCLSAGRGISLPATANASSKCAAFGLFHYIQIRDQFKMPLSKMQAIQEKFNKIIFNTWIIQSSVSMTNDILDNGEQPAVISAIMKQQTTERARVVLNEAMDIHAGASICIGYNNFLEKFYKSAPIGITVEGSNTLTRSLIIFGQGLNKSHPHIFSMLDSILSNNEESFKKEFNNITAHSIYLLIKSFNLFDNSLEQQIVNYACLTNFIAIKGGEIKKEQMLSGDMADIFSNLYLAISVKYYHIHNNASEKLTNYIVDTLIKQNQEKINKVIDNLSFLERCILIHLKKSTKTILYSREKDIFKEIMTNPHIINNIKKIFTSTVYLKIWKIVLILTKTLQSIKN